MTPESLEFRLEDARQRMIRIASTGLVTRPGFYEDVAAAHARYLELVAQLKDRNAAEARLRELSNA